MVSIVSGIAGGVAEMNDSAWRTLDPDQATFIRTFVDRTTSLALT